VNRPDRICEHRKISGNPGNQPFFARFTFLFYLSLQFSISCFSKQQPVIVLDEHHTRYEIGTLVELLEDPDHQLTFQEVSSLDYDNRFVRSQRGILNLGFTSSDYWIRFKIKNTLAREERDWILEVGNSLLHAIEFYCIDASGNITYRKTGKDVPLDQREVQVRAFLFQLTFDQQNTNTIYLRLSGNDHKMLDMVVWERDRYARYLRISDVILAFYFGILFALSAYNLFLFFSIRDRSYLYYVLFIASTALSQLHLSGWGSEYLGMEFLVGQYSFILYPFLATVFACLFSIRFLNIKNFSPVIYKVLTGYLIVLTMVTCFGFYKPYIPVVLKLGSVFMVLGAAILVGTGIFISRKGYRPARYFLVGWSVVLAGVLVMQLKHLGYLPVTLLTRYMMKFASSFEAIIFSLGLADRLHTTTLQLKMKTLETQQLAESEKMKSDFFSNITHEFRTPLMLISGHIKQLITQSKPGSEVHDRLKVAERNTAHLHRLITQLLDISRLDAGMLKVSQGQVQIKTFFRLIIGTFNSVADNRKLSFKTELDLPHAWIMTDEDKLEKIMYNILSNAFKFTDTGGVTLKASLSSLPDALNIEVADTGKGIAPEHIPMIFNRFYQVNTEGMNEGGTGIGLALTKELVTIMGGTIGVESREKAGTRFLISLPVTFIDRSETRIEPPPGEAIISSSKKKTAEDILKVFPRPGYRPTVLIVEDNDDLMQYISNGLRDQYALLSGVNGKEGLELAKKHLPDIVLTDWMMPDMDGLELCRSLKSDPLTSHIPVILITAKADTESKLKGLSQGADDYIYKPFDFDELVFKVSNRIVQQKVLQDKLRHDLLSGPTLLGDRFSEDEKFLFRLKESVEKRLSEELSVDVLRKELGLSRVQLSRKVNALVGIPVNDYIRLLRLKKAAQLLDKKWGSVSDVAYEVGFTNLSYFSKCFKEQYGKTPSEYADARSVKL
jgi:signal transduction histidine kinase/DNA-binding response OmpR family regulator